MKSIAALVIVGFILTSCSQSNVEKAADYKIVKYEITSPDRIYDVSDVARDDSIILVLSNNKLYGLDIIDNTVKEYRHNLQKLDEIILLEDSIVFISGNTLYKIQSKEEKSIVFEEYDYVSHPRPYYSETTFYMDRFVASSCCEGEWGGSIFFDETTTNQIYSTASTCLLNLDTLDGDFYLFNYLPHLSTFTNVYKIGDIESLPNVSRAHECNWYNKLLYGEASFERDSIISALRGNEDLNTLVFDTIGMPIIHGFIDGQQVKLIRRDGNKLLVLSVESKNTVRISSTLVELREGRALESRQWNHGDHTVISCSDASLDQGGNSLKQLTHLVNIDRRNRLIELFSFH